MCGALAPATPQSGDGLNDAPVKITVVSSRGEMVSGGDALIRIALPSRLRPSGVVITRNGEDVSSMFRTEAGSRSLLGIVNGLASGRNLVKVSSGGSETSVAELAITNHPLTGPVFSGLQEQPFICETSEFQLPDGKLLGRPLDASCSVRTVVSYVYRSIGDKPSFLPLPNLTELPADVAWTTTSLGKPAPYVVRVETGTINRAIYQIAVLHDPTSEPEPSPFVPLRHWNRRLLYSFGGGCIGGWYRQGVRLGGTGGSSRFNMISDSIVGKGYAHASSTLNVFGNNCSDVIAAETMMLVKEAFIERYGEPLFTFGRGGSGGAYQQIQIADNYPGLLDGIIPGATFSDVLATIQFLTDIQLLNRYFSAADPSLTEEQRRAIAGVGTFRTIAGTAPGADRIKAAGVCPPQLPVNLRYSPLENPSGSRCNVFDHTANVYGRDPATGAALRPLDNVGIQYGLEALNNGTITVSQFLDVNENIGGHDVDGNFQPSRSIADSRALEAAYRTGRVTNGGEGLARIPILDSRGYLDLRPNGDLHLKYHSFALRERLLRANGTIDNHVLLVTGEKSPPGFDAYTIDAMDQWLTNLVGDKSNNPVMVKIAGARPDHLVDSCYDSKGARIVEEQTFNGGKCNALYPTFPSPRMIAGGPATNNVLKCRLKPVDVQDYRVAFTSEERTRLTAVFPDGVCDWSRPGISHQKLAGSWLSY
jgi:hypothetical protein